MNGRIYDPVLGRFLSPDNFVQDASSTQDYNRYSYCGNNPLIYTDPSGYIRIPQTPAYDNGNDNPGGASGSGDYSIFGKYSDVMADVGIKSGDDYYDNILADYIDNQTGSTANKDAIRDEYERGSHANVYFTYFGTDENPYKYFTGIVVCNNRGNNRGIDRVDIGTDGFLKTALDYINISISSVSTVAGAGELYTRINAGVRIIYTTINGVTKWVSSEKVVSVFKIIGKYCYLGSLGIDFVSTVTGSQDAWTSTRNICVSTIAYSMGGVIGLVIGVGYTVLDRTGMLDNKPGASSVPTYTPPSITMPDATMIVSPIIINYR